MTFKCWQFIVTCFVIMKCQHEIMYFYLEMHLLSTHLEKCHSILMFESLMNRYLSAHRHTSHLFRLIAINRIEQIYFERIIISTHRHISMKVMTSRSFRIRYLSPYQHISQFRIDIFWKDYYQYTWAHLHEGYDK